MLMIDLHMPILLFKVWKLLYIIKLLLNTIKYHDDGIGHT